MTQRDISTAAAARQRVDARRQQVIDLFGLDAAQIATIDSLEGACFSARTLTAMKRGLLETA